MRSDLPAFQEGDSTGALSFIAAATLRVMNFPARALLAPRDGGAAGPTMLTPPQEQTEQIQPEHRVVLDHREPFETAWSDGGNSQGVNATSSSSRRVDGGAS